MVFLPEQVSTKDYEQAPKVYFSLSKPTYHLARCKDDTLSLRSVGLFQVQ